MTLHERVLKETQEVLALAQRYEKEGDGYKYLIHSGIVIGLQRAILFEMADRLGIDIEYLKGL